MPKTIDDWEGEGWTRADLAVGISHIPYDPATHELKLSGQRFHPDGHRMKGHERPKINATEDEAGCQLTTSAPVTVLYKLVEQEEEEEDEGEATSDMEIQPADDTEPT